MFSKLNRFSILIPTIDCFKYIKIKNVNMNYTIYTVTIKLKVCHKIRMDY